MKRTGKLLILAAALLLGACQIVDGAPTSDLRRLETDVPSPAGQSSAGQSTAGQSVSAAGSAPDKNSTATSMPAGRATEERAYLAMVQKKAGEPAGAAPEETSTPAGFGVGATDGKVTLSLKDIPYLPDSEVVDGPASMDFDVAGYLQDAGGALSRRQEYLASSGWTSAAEIISRVALENSINPRLLVALLEYQCGCVRGGGTGELENGQALGVTDYHWNGLYGQMWWAANQLATGYYGRAEGWQKEITLVDGRLLTFSEDANPGSLALVNYFSRLWAAHDQSAKLGAQTWTAMHPNGFNSEDWKQALEPQGGFLSLYREMFGDYEQRAAVIGPVIPIGLQQPELILPFEHGRLWSFTSGPHRAWEKEGSQAALDFAPASDKTGCLPTDAWVVAAGDGPVVRVGSGLVVQDLDGAAASDGQEETGWAIVYMHIASQGRVELGKRLRAGERIGQPSCEGGPATGTHLHIARKYNGQWIAAVGGLPFVLDGWTAEAGPEAVEYQGIMVKEGQTVIAHNYASFETHITRPELQPRFKPWMLPDYMENEANP